MGPKRKTQVAKAQPTASDYDTDTNNYTDTGLPMTVIPPPPNRTSEELNMAVLRRWYPSIQSIIAIAPFAVVYDHVQETGQWEKTDTQGTLFICHMQEEENNFPTYRAIILNRKNPENWVWDIQTSEDIDFADSYVIVQRAEEGTIHGIWIYSDGDSQHDRKQIVYDAISECAARMDQLHEDAQRLMQLQEETAEQYQRNDATTSEQVIATETVTPVAVPQSQPVSQNQIPQEQGQRIDINALFARPPSNHPQNQQNTLLNLFKS
ncbi:mRNA-decapping enzyme subunit 1 [Pseudocercospora fuligena]|uniref:mRNA-decapping enzyme subunit 1 n=1 Tax=Pseudocercospora fuligena TaxID=685502 RepID=A0A8H6R9G3_9PEZI|nr:mRNA-decapping enzyme subunit 1 [Pseudocercospora fuligena]